MKTPRPSSHRCADCGEPEDADIHDSRNEQGHFFNNDEPVIQDRIAILRTRAAQLAADEWLRPRPRREEPAPEVAQPPEPRGQLVVVDRWRAVDWPSGITLRKQIRDLLQDAESPMSITELTESIPPPPGLRKSGWRGRVYTALHRLAADGKAVCFFETERAVDSHGRKTWVRLSRWWRAD